VKFTPTGRAHSFVVVEPVDRLPSRGEEVVVRSPDGPAVGRVVATVPVVSSRRKPPPEAALVFVRKASADDLAARAKRQERERAAYQFCLLKIRERNLPMKLTRTEQLADGSRLLFYFTSDGRVDFRELVRDLAAEFRTRIEMRQIGVRDEARLLGGYGGCGRPLCCTTWLQSFEPVSIKMAKQQNLSLNPSKLSGLCGRLKCCLRYELGSGDKTEKYAGAAHEPEPASHLCSAAAAASACGRERSAQVCSGSGCARCAACASGG
jgi:cell fate regulator YaaT (PSP1 superfamily)